MENSVLMRMQNPNLIDSPDPLIKNIINNIEAPN